MAYMQTARNSFDETVASCQWLDDPQFSVAIYAGRLISQAIDDLDGEDHTELIKLTIQLRLLLRDSLGVIPPHYEPTIVEPEEPEDELDKIRAIK